MPSVRKKKDLVMRKTKVFSEEKNKQIHKIKLWVILKDLVGYCKKENINNQKYIYNHLLWLTKNATNNSVSLCSYRKQVFKESYLAKKRKTLIYSAFDHYPISILPFKIFEKQRFLFQIKHLSWKRQITTWALEFTFI